MHLQEQSSTAIDNDLNTGSYKEKLVTAAADNDVKHLVQYRNVVSCAELVWDFVTSKS